MKRLRNALIATVLSITIFVTIGTTYAVAPSKFINTGMEKVIVKRVIDGDTFTTAAGKTVRLIGIDTPETVKPNTPVQPYGKEASAFSKKILTGRTIYMRKDVGNTDKYGRLLRYVYLTDGTFFNDYLVKYGYARIMTIPPNVAFSNQFLASERYARQNEKGLWRLSVNQPLGNKSSTSNTQGLIKGNINSRGEKIYHCPGQRFYNVTKPERWFRTEQEAQKAGFRKSKV